MYRRTSLVTFVCSLFALIAAPAARADVKLPAVISDHMVLQRDLASPIWGWADAGEDVTVTLGDYQSQTAKPDATGKWMVRLPKLSAGGPLTLTVKGKNTIAIQDVLVGEVWLCSGQSNMEWPLKASYQPTNDIAASANPKLRLFLVPKVIE